MEQALSQEQVDSKMSYESFRQAILDDYRMAVISREVSLLGRREVLTGKGKFGIFGDGKEVAQIAAAKFFQPGDFRAGYYISNLYARSRHHQCATVFCTTLRRS